MSEGKSYYYVIGVLLLVIISSLSFTVFNSKSATSKSNLETCNPIHYSGENKISLLFFASQGDANSYTDFFLETSPYSEIKDSFNINYIDSFSPDCEIYKGIALFCDSTELRKKSASCPSDIIIVVKDESQNMRSSAYRNVISLNLNHEKSVLTHELGHAISNLAEEYINHQSPARLSTNCQSFCSSFGLEMDGCFEGCSQSTLFRSIENGVMRSLSSNNYGKYNENIIKEIVSKRVFPEISLTGKATADFSSCEKTTSILIDSASGENELIQGCPSLGIGLETYSITKDNLMLYEGFYNEPILYTDSPNHELDLEGETFVDSSLPSYFVVSSEAKDLIISEESFSLEKAGARPCKK